MLMKNDLLENINNGGIERAIRLSPVNYKLLYWNQIDKFIEPINIDCSGFTLEQAQNNICSLVANNDLLRTKIFDVYNINVMKMADGEFPVYYLEELGEKKIFLFKMAREMMNSSIFGRLLYDGAFFVYHNSIEFSGIFHHLVTDGVILTAANKKGVDLKYYQNDYNKYEEYLNKLSGNKIVDFQGYAQLKGKLVDEFLCDEMVYFHFTFTRESRICNQKMTLEEFWASIISSYVKSLLNMKSIPLHINSGGRTFDKTTITSFGDYHDDYIFVIEDESEFIQEFRYYRNIPYLNAEQYKEHLFQNTEYREVIEPISMCLKWKMKELDEFRKKKTLLPNHEKKYVLGFEVLINQNIKEVQVNISASRKMKDLIEHAEAEFERLIDEYMI